MTEGNLELVFTDENFSEQVEKAENQIILVDFWAPWCGPCKISGPVITEIAKQYEKNDKVKIGNVNVDESNDMAEKYEVRSIPTVKIFLNGHVVDESIGAVPKEILVEKIESAIKKIK